MQMHFGDGEADLSRPIAEYLVEDPLLARDFLRGYLSHTPLLPGFVMRFSVYMLHDRAILWEYFQRHDLRWWDEAWTFRDWASHFLSVEEIL
jgi:hygromycin-B 7''-O-kinase